MILGMKKISAALAALTMLCTVLLGVTAVTTSSPASATGCGDLQSIASTTGWVAGDNLRIAGRPLKWRFVVQYKDCDGYDLIKDVSATLSKGDIGCVAQLGTTDGYYFNPNSLSGVNPGRQWVNCISTAGNYGVSFPAFADQTITSNMDATERCLNFTFGVDLEAAWDPEYTNADPICFNGL